MDAPALGVMMNLARHPMTAGQISRASGIGRTVVRNRLRQLEELELVESTPTRIYVIHTLTAGGYATLSFVDPALNDYQTWMPASRNADRNVRSSP